jgi:methionyl-tRNA formyltransferase
MNVAAIGRTQMLYDTIVTLTKAGHVVTAIITAPAAPEYSKTERHFEELAAELGVPIFITTRLDDPEIIAVVARTDIAVSVNWVSVLKQKHLDIFKYGILNAHAGDLPKYRGNACPNWAILAGEKEIALTVHRMVPEELDCGEIIAQAKFPLNSESTIGDVYAWMQQSTPELFAEAITTLQSDPKFRLAVAGAGDPDGFRCYPRFPEDGYVDWSQSAEQIDALIRASGAPFAGAYCYMRYEGEVKKLMLLKSRVETGSSLDRAVPGQVLKNVRISGESWIQCGSNILVLSLGRFEGESEEFRPGDRWRTIRLRLGVRPEDWLWENYKRQQVKHLELSELVPVGR